MIGRVNHVALAVPDLAAATKTCKETLGAKVPAPQAARDHGAPRIGAHGHPVLFVHPKDFFGTSVEREPARG
jgi:methylmalonyl-CoA/ethylmalonyl-CoA epimerase